MPATIQELLARAGHFRRILESAKDLPPGPEASWYPYDTMTSIDHLCVAIRNDYPEFARALRLGALLDVGCGDGDLSYFFQSLGLDVTAVDNRPTNYNWMAGVRTLGERLGAPIEILERDVDSSLALPERTYGLTLLLGILYHLKNPFLVLETVARQSRYCVVSTRVADVTPKRTSIGDQSLSYLLAAGETNRDVSNYWIFSSVALKRLVERSGWRVISQARVGCRRNADPVRADRDGRDFLFLQSRMCSAPARVRFLEGWRPRESHGWSWTLKRFGLAVELTQNEPVRQFALDFFVPEAIAAVSDVEITCTADGKVACTRIFKGAGEHRLEGIVPVDLKQNEPLTLLFSVEHRYKPDPPETSELGIIVHRRGSIYGHSESIPIWFD